MKAKQILVTFVTLVVGYVLGSLIGLPPSLDALNSGDISKASKFNKAIESPELEAFKEKLLSDTTEMQNTVITVALLNARIEEFDTLTTLAIQAADGKEELVEAICRLEGVKQLAANARKAGQMATKSLDALLAGKKNPDLLPYDQASQNMVLAYLLLNNQNDAGKEFVQAVDVYLKGKSIDEYQELASVREMWAMYCAAAAVLNEDKSEIAYWSETQSVMDRKAMLGSEHTQTVNKQVIDNQQYKKQGEVIESHETSQIQVNNFSGVSNIIVQSYTSNSKIQVNALQDVQVEGALGFGDNINILKDQSNIKINPDALGQGISNIKTNNLGSEMVKIEPGGALSNFGDNIQVNSNTGGGKSPQRKQENRQ